MKYLIVSDIHGSLAGCERLKNALFRENPDCLLLLGDLLHGGYDGDENAVIRVISSFKKGVLAVAGNCDDSPSDGLALGVELPGERSFSFHGFEVRMQHRPYYLRYPAKTILLNGHTHRKILYGDSGVIYCNPGSISLPRDDCASYAVMDEEGIALLNAENGLILERLLF